jgi:hypothetical protein
MPNYVDYAQLTFGAVVAWGAMTADELAVHVVFAQGMDEKLAHVRGVRAEMDAVMIPVLAEIALSYSAPWNEQDLCIAFNQSIPNALVRDSAVGITAWNHYLSDARADVIVVQNPNVAAQP